MLNELLDLLEGAGAPRDVTRTPLPFYLDTRSGDVHGDPDCPHLPGDARSWDSLVETIRVTAAEARGCECAEASLVHTPGLEELIGIADDALDLNSRLGTLEGWRGWLEIEGRNTSVSLIHETLTGARGVLGEIDERLEAIPRREEWLETWYENLKSQVETAEEEFHSELSAPESIERLLDAAVAETFSARANHDDVQRTMVEFGPEILEFLGEERDHPSPEIEWVLREEYGAALRNGLDEDATRARLHAKIVEYRPASLTSEMFPFAPAFLPKPDQSVQAWLEDLWDEEARDVAKLAESWYRHVTEELRTRECLAVLEAYGLPEGREATLVYRRKKVHGSTVLVLPEAVARELSRINNPTDMRGANFRWAALEDADEKVVETAIGLYDPNSSLMKDIENALEAARLV